MEAAWGNFLHTRGIAMSEFPTKTLIEVANVFDHAYANRPCTRRSCWSQLLMHLQYAPSYFSRIPSDICTMLHKYLLNEPTSQARTRYIQYGHQQPCGDEPAFSSAYCNHRRSELCQSCVPYDYQYLNSITSTDMVANLQYCRPTPEFILKLHWYIVQCAPLNTPLRAAIATFAAKHCLPNLVIYLKKAMGQPWVICNYLRDAGVSPRYVQYYEKILQS